MANDKNLMLVLHERRIQNFKSQFKSVVLEGFEIFGKPLVDIVYKECSDIYEDYLKVDPDIDIHLD